MLKTKLVVMVSLFAASATLAQYPSRGRLSGGATASGGTGGGGTTYTATAPVDVTGTIISLPAAGAGQSGYLRSVSGLLTVDAGFRNVSADISSFAGGLLADGIAVAGSGITTPSTGRVSVTEVYSYGNLANFYNTQPGGGYWSAGSSILMSQVADGASAVSTVSNTQSAWSTLGAKLHSFQTAGSEKAYVGVGGEFVSSSTKTRATVSLSGGGTATATVLSGAVCVCSYATTGIIVLTCAVSSTTLTMTGTASASVSYICL